MKNFLKTDIKIYFILIISLVTFCSGCASSFSTLRANDPKLNTRYYNASYNKVINAVVEAASKIEGWKVEDVDESQGLITVKDDTPLRLYYIKIFVRSAKNRQTRVDLQSFSPYTYVLQGNKKYIAEFLQKLDSLLN